MTLTAYIGAGCMNLNFKLKRNTIMLFTVSSSTVLILLANMFRDKESLGSSNCRTPEALHKTVLFRHV